MIEKYEQIIERICTFRECFFLNATSESDYHENFPSLVTFEGGSQPPKDKHIYKFENGYIRFIQNRDYSSNNHITYIPVSNLNKLCNKTDIMIDKYGEAGKVRYGIDGAYNVALMKITPLKENHQEFIRDFLSQKNIEKELYNSSQASTRPSLNESTYLGLLIPIIEEKQLQNYEFIMKNILETELNYKSKISNLKMIKEKLLFKYF